MRHIRVRRRFKLILIALLAACLIFFAESRIEAFVPHIKNYAILKMEEMFDGKVKLSIGSVDGGILHPLVLNDIKISDKKGTLLFSSVDINSIRTNYRIWDVFFSGKGGSVISNLLSRDSKVYVNFVSKDEKIDGFVKIEGDLENSRVKGYINLFDTKRIDFVGTIKPDSFDLDIKRAKTSIRAQGTLSDDGGLAVSLNVNHLKLGNYDIVFVGKLKNKIVRMPNDPKMDRVEGEFEANNLILNYKPFIGVKAYYIISDGILKIVTMNMGEIFNLRGNISLREPYTTDIVVLANNVNLVWLMSSLGVKDPEKILSGTMNAKFEIKGPVSKMKSNMDLDIRKGAISELSFERLSANLKGDGPVIRIEDSRITRESGYFALTGEMDLKKLGKNSLFDGIKIATDDRAITWDGLDTASLGDVKELTMTKKLSDEVNIGFKKILTDEKIDESSRYNDEVQFEYKLHENDSFNVRMGKDQDFFGLEHKDKF